MDWAQLTQTLITLTNYWITQIRFAGLKDLSSYYTVPKLPHFVSFFFCTRLLCIRVASRTLCRVQLTPIHQTLSWGTPIHQRVNQSAVNLLPFTNNWSTLLSTNSLSSTTKALCWQLPYIDESRSKHSAVQPTPWHQRLKHYAVCNPPYIHE